MTQVKLNTFVLMVVLGALLSATTYAGTLKFDFGPMGQGDYYGIPITPEPGYIGVDATMMYGDQQAYGLDYGITLYDGASTAVGDHKSSWHTRNSQTSLAIDFVYFND